MVQPECHTVLWGSFKMNKYTVWYLCQTIIYFANWWIILAYIVMATSNPVSAGNLIAEIMSGLDISTLNVTDKFYSQVAAI